MPQQVADELVGIGVSPQKIVHIPNGVEITAENPKNRYEIIDKVVVLFVGRLHPQKGVDILLQAFKRAQEAKPEIKWCLKLVGNGYLLDYLQKMSLDLSINQSVEFLGEVNNPESLYVSSDLFTLPSRSEGISNALLEAMAHGLPCIVTDIPGNNDVIKDRENGFLTASDDFENMANAVVELAGDSNLRRKIGEAAYRSVVENFSLDKITEQYFNLYRNLLSSKKHT